jgi:hypothetical protein
VRIFAGTISVPGAILADGGDGGVKRDGSCTSGAGGGGGGGSIWLRGMLVDVSGRVSAAGGDGGPEGGATDQYGGDGSDGRIRIDAEELVTTGDITPEPGYEPGEASPCP